MIRQARPGDEGVLLAIQRAAAVAALGHIFPRERYPFPDDTIRDRWERRLREEEATTLIAEVDGRPAGLVCHVPGWLASLFVVPDQWGTGLAAGLHDRAVSALERPCHLWVLEENHRARRFYERRGWRPDGERRPADFPPWPAEVRYTLDDTSES